MDVRHVWAWFLAMQGRFEEAITEIQIILETDPLSRRANRALVIFLHSARQTEQAVEQLRHALELDPGSELLHVYKGRLLAAQGKYDEAVAELERPTSERHTQLKHLGWTYARAGRVDEARAVLQQLDEIARRSHVSHGIFAFVHAGLGENDRAFEWLGKGFAERDPELLYLKLEPEWDPIRDDPRFDDLIRRVPYFIED